MVGLVLDAGALIAVERGGKAVRAQLDLAQRRNMPLFLPTGVLAQYWRGGSGRQTPASRLIATSSLVSLTPNVARDIGVLLGKAQTSDVVDASVALLAHEAGAVLTSDPDDIGVLLQHLESEAVVIYV